MTDAEKLEPLLRRAGIMPSMPYNASDWPIKEYAEYAVRNGVEAAILYNHDFARALFGEEERDDCPACGYDAFYCAPIWQWHLSRAVVSDNPIDYIYEAVFGDNNPK